jgi:hypothetical protein
LGLGSQELFDVRNLISSPELDNSTGWEHEQEKRKRSKGMRWDLGESNPVPLLKHFRHGDIWGSCEPYTRSLSSLRLAAGYGQEVLEPKETKKRKRKRNRDRN